LREIYPTLADPDLLREGVEHVRRADPALGRLVEAHGSFAFKPQGRVFQSLVESMLSQQLNGKVADLIISRVNSLFHPGRPTAERLHRVSVVRLRSAGVSPQKIGYLKDLSARMVQGKLDLSHIARKSDDVIMRELDEIKGVGPWTAHMVLMFSLGRPDVLPVDDYGIKKAISEVYQLPELPKREAIEIIARPWHPFSTVACLYLWRHRDLPSLVSSRK
jgi:3-methyladenine DNA glycosylase/8-oxoguanine DNA glycosylase